MKEYKIYSTLQIACVYVPQFVADFCRKQCFLRTDPDTWFDNNEGRDFNIYHVGDDNVYELITIEYDNLTANQYALLTNFAMWVAENNIDWIQFGNPVNPGTLQFNS